ncbi:MmcQ/YjbR family DNA-binding protein [Aeromicrobium sp. CF4.19]|uniref:MmcQ/YjbR family DNA-binding protein n=1 Tax=Aeromicrobium sp. CF4.19 TaxID=3373082 RepID=UPI003EE4F3D4
MVLPWSDLASWATRTFPDTDESTSYGTPALKVKGRLLCRLRTEAEGLLALKCSSEDKLALVDGGDPAFSTLPHYDGHGYVLVDLDLVDAEELRELLTDAWLRTAPPRVRQTWQD